MLCVYEAEIPQYDGNMREKKITGKRKKKQEKYNRKLNYDWCDLKVSLAEFVLILPSEAPWCGVSCFFNSPFIPRPLYVIYR